MSAEKTYREGRSLSLALRRASQQHASTSGSYRQSKKFPNGDTYSGGWRNGVPEGEGRYCWADGSTYEGGWRVQHLPKPSMTQDETGQHSAIAAAVETTLMIKRQLVRRPALSRRSTCCQWQHIGSKMRGVLLWDAWLLTDLTLSCDCSPQGCCSCWAHDSRHAMTMTRAAQSMGWEHTPGPTWLHTRGSGRTDACMAWAPSSPQTALCMRSAISPTGIIQTMSLCSCVQEVRPEQSCLTYSGLHTHQLCSPRQLLRRLRVIMQNHAGLRGSKVGRCRAATGYGLSKKVYASWDVYEPLS